MKLDLESLAVLEVELRDRLQIEWGARQYFHASCTQREAQRLDSTEDVMSRQEETLKRGVYIRNIRVPLSGLQLIQLARQCLKVPK